MSSSTAMNVDGEKPYVEFKENKTAFERRIREFDLINNGYTTINEFLIGVFEIYKEKMIEVVTEFDLIKTTSCLCADFERSFVVNEQNDVLSEKRDMYLTTKNCEIDS